VYTSPPPTCYLHRPSHTSRFYQQNNIGRGIQIIIIIIIISSSSSSSIVVVFNGVCFDRGAVGWSWMTYQDPFKQTTCCVDVYLRFV
jgi:hypothetical protein